MNLIDQLSVEALLGRYLKSCGKYLLFAGLVYLLFYVWKRRAWIHLRIQQQFPTSKKIWTEIKWSILSRLIFATVGLATAYCTIQGYTKQYFNNTERGWLYFFASVVSIIFTHDTYFYWIHRLMHWKPVFEHVHRVHHLSTNPTPWAAYSFHPIEALLEAAIFPLLVFTIPLHPAAMLLLANYQMFMNLVGHCGYELMPRGFTQHKPFKWYNTSTHHNIHHAKFNCNYGLYFNIWDRLMGTNHLSYDAIFEQVKTKKPQILGDR
jgi:Delta7-sterol 5-desaturase